MQFSINTKEFVRVLSSIQGIIDKAGQNQQSILSYVYLQAIDSQLIVNATNFNLTFVDRLEATVEVEGAYLCESPASSSNHEDIIWFGNKDLFPKQRCV